MWLGQYKTLSYVCGKMWRTLERFVLNGGEELNVTVNLRKEPLTLCHLNKSLFLFRCLFIIIIIIIVVVIGPNLSSKPSEQPGHSIV
jgi:hypothetical protein